MPTTRISERARAILKEIAHLTRRSQKDVLEEALESYRRDLFLERVNEAFAALRYDAEAWKEEEAERRDWDVTLPDGADC